ncbi:plant UBX domain-containing protein 11 [Hordeum vulgare subsp. vulgare]|uniref:UBX domain-containing protein n=1 Tax=Hordeum vulgare subsp. vulgare TaxID=112509 RepID=M0WM22_HORVV|nr:plant UBX domain-containing protein 11 [Hordeum vulgare subsp. vulgare]XP_044980331.1 plant UBX domain-containing protein 11 [Hordeum vulgare subsp. vulgare]XP_044980333.1 plant UBX domain-containing protein 11 [Hordeum vulgare subsp. vulgare]
MEITINSLTYKGSIPDAINQSRREKKLFVIYISGQDETSSNLEQSTLVDEHVAAVISRCCVFLQLKQGDVDTLQFSAIYPQKSVPSISVIGLNGAMLWNHEGYISPEDLKESIEKAWAALHLQETAATLLTASLASRMAEPANTASSTMPAQEGSSTSENHSNSSGQSSESSAVRGFANSTNLVAQPPSSTSQAELLKTSEIPKSDSASCNIAVEEKLDSACQAVLPDFSASSNIENSTEPNQTVSTPKPKSKNKVDGSSTKDPSKPASSIPTRSTQQLPVEQDKATTSRAIEVTTDSAKKDDIQLAIRMPDGPSLQIKLTKEDVLRKVKTFVDENQGSGIGSYNLAMLYPKKVFTEQDMETTLYELGIETRQALVVVPSVKVARHQSSLPSSDLDRTGNSDKSGGWGFLGAALSYVNPLSYLRGNPTPSNLDQLGNEGSQQYKPSSESQPLRGDGSQQPATHSSGNTLRRRPRQFGGNIHTLNSEEQDPSDNRNVFWNGNSTEFGGDEKK